MASTAIVVILEKITSKDKDFRYMATSDLLHELQKDTFKVDSEQERKLCNVILTQLEDPSGDISNLAVSCLGHLARKVAESRAEDLVRQLCDKLISRGGGLLPADIQGRVRDALLAALMGEGRLLLRKKALQGLAALSVYLTDDALAGVVGPLLAALQQQPGVKADFARTYVQAVGQVSRAVGYRFGRYLSVAVPLAALEGFVLRCPHDTRPLLEPVRRAATRILVALIGRYPDQLPPLYRAALPELVGRFEREREEGVKGDVFAAVGELLAQGGALEVLESFFAALAAASGQVAATVEMLLATVNSAKDPGSQRLALLCLGEIGGRSDLSTLPAASLVALEVVSAVKYAVVDRPHPVDGALGPVLLDFLRLMGDGDRHVRRAAPGLVSGGLPALLPLLYAQTAIDDGLELRKAAFECLDILHDCCRDRLQPEAFLAALESGLGDHADVKAPCHTLLSKLAATDPGAVLAAAERLVAPLQKTLTTRLKSDAVITVRIIDSCPCRQVLKEGAPGVAKGGEVRRQEWCCGGQNHFDLSYFAFEDLAHPQHTEHLDPRGPSASLDSFLPSHAGAGLSNDSATCVQLSPGGGLTFRCRACGITPGYQPFAGASGLSLWIRPNSNSSDPFASSTPNNTLPPLKLFVTSDDRDAPNANGTIRYCFNEVYFNSTSPAATRPVPGSNNTWYQMSVPLSAFKCEGAVATEQLNRFDLQNVAERDAFFCLDKIGGIMDASVVASGMWAPITAGAALQMEPPQLPAAAAGGTAATPQQQPEELRPVRPAAAAPRQLQQVSAAGAAGGPMPARSPAVAAGVTRASPVGSFTPAGPSPGWLRGRTTYYGGPDFLSAAYDPARGEGSFGILSHGECGYTNSDGTLPFAREGYAASADANYDYPGSCGRCYQIKCVDGAVAENSTAYVHIENGYFGGDPGRTYLPAIKVVRDTRNRTWPGNPGEGQGLQVVKCWDTNKVVTVRIADACPCRQVLPDGAPGVKAGGEVRRQEWCCGGQNHFDLSYFAFEDLAHPVYGVMGGGLDGQDGTCVQLSPGGGLAFRCRACGTTPGYQPFAGASGLSLWIRPNSNSSDPFASSTPNNALPPLKLFVTSETPEGKRYCFNEIYFNTGVFPNGTDAVATRPSNWYQVAVPMSAFKCQGAVPTEQLNRFELQNVNERDAFFCLDKVQILKGRGSSEGRGSGREAAGEGGSGGTGGGGGGQ
eukprot:XP_001703433.1 predicted protein [Chlamydomonas reinhardtii]